MILVEYKVKNNYKENSIASPQKTCEIILLMYTTTFMYKTFIFVESWSNIRLSTTFLPFLKN